MKDGPYEFKGNGDIEREAANWTLRIDRGLTAEEQDSYSQWLADDPRHREAIALYRWGWNELERLSGLQASTRPHIDPNLLAPGNPFARGARRRRLMRYVLASFPAAAAIAVGLFFWAPVEDRSTGSQIVESVAPIPGRLAQLERRNLSDGSRIELNRGARIETVYTNEERLVKLLSGEGNFIVAKDPDRPFVVEVDGVRVRALGTVFNIRSSAEEVDVVVTEGKVLVEAVRGVEGSAFPRAPVVGRGQRAIVTAGLDQSRLQVLDLRPEELEEALLWQPRLLDFNAAPLKEIVAEFNRRNPVRIVIDSPALEDRKLSCSFWSDNIEGFVRLMDASFGMQVLYRGDEIVLAL